jgi:hypothetical protein
VFSSSGVLVLILKLFDYRFYIKFLLLRIGCEFMFLLEQMFVNIEILFYVSSTNYNFQVEGKTSMLAYYKIPLRKKTEKFLIIKYIFLSNKN